MLGILLYQVCFTDNILLKSTCVVEIECLSELLLECSVFKQKQLSGNLPANCPALPEKTQTPPQTKQKPPQNPRSPVMFASLTNNLQQEYINL